MSSYDEDHQFTEFVREVRKDLVPKLTQSAYVMSFLPSSDGIDVKYCLELGMSIMLDKPIIAIVLPGVEVPAKMRLVADHFIEITEDPDTEAGQQQIADKVNAVLTKLESER